MDDEVEILVIALTNSIAYYKEALEACPNLDMEEIELINYTITRHEELLNKYTQVILSKIQPTENKPISRPSWTGK